MRLKEIPAYFAERILMFHMNALKKCVLNATKLVIKPKTAKKLILFNVESVIILVIGKIDVLKSGLSLLKEGLSL